MTRNVTTSNVKVSKRRNFPASISVTGHKLVLLDQEVWKVGLGGLRIVCLVVARMLGVGRIKRYIMELGGGGRIWSSSPVGSFLSINRREHRNTFH